MELLIKYLGSGKIEKHSKNPVINLAIVKFSDINNIVIPFFEKYPLNGTKQLDYTDWVKIAKIINEGSHLTAYALKVWTASPPERSIRLRWCTQ